MPAAAGPRSSTSRFAPASARWAAITAIWATLSMTNSCPFGITPEGSNSVGARRTSTVDSSDPLRTLRIADSPAYNCSNTRSGSPPCGETNPMPVTKTRRRPAAVVLSSFGLDQLVDERSPLAQRREVRPLVGNVDTVLVRHIEHQLGDRERIKPEFCELRVRADYLRLHVM